MKSVSIHEAKTHLSKLLEEFMAGEAVIAAKAGKPMLQLVKIGSMAGNRPLGLLARKGKEPRMLGCRCGIGRVLLRFHQTGGRLQGRRVIR